MRSLFFRAGKKAIIDVGVCFRAVDFWKLPASLGSMLQDAVIKF